MSKGMPTHMVAKDVIFGTAIHDDNAEVVAEQGIMMLYTESDHKCRPLPPGVRIPVEQLGKTLSVIVRDLTDSIILEPGVDDYYEDELSKNNKVMPLSSTRDVEELFNELKIQMFTRTAGHISTFIAGIALSVSCWWLWRHEFMFPIVVEIGMVMGLPIGILLGLIPFIKMMLKLNCDYLADVNGKWVNIRTGETNLNGGIQIPTEEGYYE